MISNKQKKELKRRSFVLFENALKDSKQSKDLKTKFNNINGKTGSYNVPNDLFQQRTNRSNRVLIEWKTVMENELNMDDLSLFEGDVVIAFINNDYFDEVESEHQKLFIKLKSLLGSDGAVSSMILLKSEGGEPSSKIQRDAYKKLIKEFPNYKEHFIKRKDIEGRFPGKGNNMFKGFIYYDIRGGQQDRIYSHEGLPAPGLFNPAVEYASTNVCLDIDLTLHFFALKSVLIENRDVVYDNLIKDFENTLKQIIYPEISNGEKYDSLLDYCSSHASLKIDTLGKSRELYDPIQFEKIHLKDFALKSPSNIKSIDLSHNVPVNFEEFYVDRVNNEILSAARPTNLFWSRHLSNMMQQNSTLIQYFERQEELVNLRNLALENEKK